MCNALNERVELEHLYGSKYNSISKSTPETSISRSVFSIL